jgi:hypothetical protein
MEDALDLAEVHPLKPLPLDLKTRQQAFEEAVADIAAQLHRLPGLPDIVWPDLCRRVEIPDLSGAPYGSMMRLHLSALVGLLQAGPARQPTNGYASHEKVLMIHESRYWRRSAAAAGLDLTEQTLANAVVISTLLGAANKTQALALLGRVQGLRNANEDLLVRVHEWLCTLYPSAAEGEWGPLEPDRLGEYLVGMHLLEWPELLDEPFAVAQDEQLHQAFHVLARASAEHLHVGELLKRRVTSQLKRYGPVALRVVTETENPDFLIAALEDGVTSPDTADIATLVELAQTFPSRAPALNLLVERLMKLAINLYQRLLAEGVGDYRPKLAQAWQQLGDHLDENQRRDEAIEAREMALRLFRELSGREQSAHAGAPDE